MMIKTPKFWLKTNFFSLLFLPFSLIYQIIFSLNKFFTKQNQISKKVICIGNLIVGGSGKTPVAIEIGKILKKQNINFAYLSRGYRSKERNFTKVINDSANAIDVGDEPLLLAEIAPTFISKNRAKGAKNLEENYQFDVILLDDGMQNNSLKKDFTILVIDGKIKFGNQFLFPAGPLRQSLKSGFAQADLIIVIGKIDTELQQILSENIGENLSKITTAQIKPKNLDSFQGLDLIAFCGLAYPEKFFSFLQNQNLNLIEKINFPDHYFYQEKDLIQLLEIARDNNSKLVTTKKDWIKFPKKYREKIDFLDIELELKNENLLIEKLSEILRK